MPETTTGWALLLLLSSHALYAVLLVLRAVLGNRQDRDFLGEGVLHGVSAYTALLWGPFVLLVMLVRVAVLDPLRLEINLGAMHHGENTDGVENARRRFKGRTMRKVMPGVSVGTYTFTKWLHDVDLQGSVTNRLLEIGGHRVGITFIRLGEPVADADEEQPRWAREKATR